MAEKEISKPEKRVKAEEPAKSEKQVKSEKPAKAEKQVQANKPAKAEKQVQANKPAKAGKQVKARKPEKAKKPSKAEKTEKVKKPGKKIKFDNADLYHDIEDEKHSTMKNKKYFRELRKLEIELIRLQEWVKAKKLKMVVIFEGRDAAGKGGVIKTISGCLNPRICRVVALGTPTEKEKTQWYFQRYVPFLPAGGEIVLFDRSWYNRAGVEKVMGFCTDEEYDEFLRSCPEFEKMLIRSGIILVKYWFSVSDHEQEKRFQDRINDPTKRWKISPMDVESRDKWIEYSMAKDKMFSYTDTRQCPWFVVEGDDKKRARLNTISHLISLVPYEDLTPPPFKLPPLKKGVAYVRPPKTEQTHVPEKY